MPTFTVRPFIAARPRSAEKNSPPVYSINRHGSVVSLKFAGPRIGEREAVLISPYVRTELAELGPTLKGLVLDLSQVKVMSSFGLGLCIELRNVAMSQRAGTVLYGMSADIRELFRVMNVDRLFTIAVTSQNSPE